MKRQAAGGWLPRPGARALVAACSALACLAGLRLADAQDGQSLKAAIVVNMLQFVQWPDEADKAGRPLTLCADRAGALWDQLLPLQGRAARATRPLEVRSLPSNAEGLRQCDVWVVEQDAGTKSLRPNAAVGQPILLIGERERSDDGVLVVALHWRGERLAFDIDLQAARRNGLQVSSKLLRLAARVQE